jgi:hypothetical protein
VLEADWNNHAPAIEGRATLEVVKKKTQGAILYGDNYNYVL